MHAHLSSFGRRIESLRTRLQSLSSLRKLVGLQPGRDIAARQWTLIESQLGAAQQRLQARIQRASREHLPRSHEPREARKLNSVLGEVEMDLSRAFDFFDTYIDVLTQRQMHMPLAGT
jgi:hypothetical protein